MKVCRRARKCRISSVVFQYFGSMWRRVLQKAFYGNDELGGLATFRRAETTSVRKKLRLVHA